MKSTLIALAFISLAGLAIVSLRLVPARAAARAVPVSEGSCADRYNSLLQNAKTALVIGDRAATVDLLEKAKHMLSTCPALKDGASSQTVVSSLRTQDGARVA
jgi:hypothetical protein